MYRSANEIRPCGFHEEEDIELLYLLLFSRYKYIWIIFFINIFTDINIMFAFWVDIYTAELGLQTWSEDICQNYIYKYQNIYKYISKYQVCSYMQQDIFQKYNYHVCRYMQQSVGLANMGRFLLQSFALNINRQTISKAFMTQCQIL